MYERSISYNKLWKLLVDKKMSAADLRRAADISHNTLGKLRRDEAVSMEIIIRLCTCLDCNVGDILDIAKAGETGEPK